MDEQALESLDQLAAKATPGPWRNIKREWNKALDDYYRANRKHWHGSLWGSRHKQSNKHCGMLIVRDNIMGRPISLDQWRGVPDYYDFKRVLAHPMDFLFPSRGRATLCVEDSASLDDSADADFIAAANPATVRALIAALRAERAWNSGARA